MEEGTGETLGKGWDGERCHRDAQTGKVQRTPQDGGRGITGNSPIGRVQKRHRKWAECRAVLNRECSRDLI